MTIPVTAYKSLAPNEYTITPFRAYASHIYTYVSGSTVNPVDVTVSLGIKFDTASQGLRTEDSTYELFDSIVQTFYSPIPYTSYGIQSSSYHPTGSVFVVSATQDIFGEEIKPGTFTVKIGTSSSIDDGYKLNPTDFLYSVYNPSANKVMFTGSTATPLELMASQSLYPYITTIGLYNPDNELVAVAKVSNPIQRTDYTIQTFVVKFDT